MRLVKYFVLIVFCLFILSQAADKRTALTIPDRNLFAGPTITVTSPKAGESYKIGSPMAISWKYSGNVGQSVRVFLNKLSTPASNQPLVSVGLDGSGTGSCNVPVPKALLPGSDYLIVVESNQNPGIKHRSGLFSLVAGPDLNRNRTRIGIQQARPGSLPLINVNQPGSDEEWWFGSSHDISWMNRSGDNSFLVNIALLRGDAVQRQLAAGIPVSQGKFNWKILDIASGKYRVHITDPSEKIFGTSDVFSIIRPGFTVLPVSPDVYHFYSKGSPPDDKIKFAWTFIGKIGSQVSITWVPDYTSSQKATPFVIVPECPIGVDGKGKFLWNEIMNSSNLFLVLKGQPEKKLFGHAELKVIGTNFSAKSNMFTLILNE